MSSDLNAGPFMRPLCLLAAASLIGCAHYIPPAPPSPRQATAIAAPFDRTWDAVIDVFAQQVITIETMERASGFIVASRAGIARNTRRDSTEALGMADCGRLGVSLGTNPSGYLPTSAKYNVVVRPSGATSTIQVTAKFLRAFGATSSIECTSKGGFEDAFERRVKAIAERPAP